MVFMIFLSLSRYFPSCLRQSRGNRILMEEMNRHYVREGWSFISLQARQISKISKFMLELILVKALLIDADVTGACDGNISNNSSASGGAQEGNKDLTNVTSQAFSDIDPRDQCIWEMVSQRNHSILLTLVEYKKKETFIVESAIFCLLLDHRFYCRTYAVKKPNLEVQQSANKAQQCYASSVFSSAGKGSRKYAIIQLQENQATGANFAAPVVKRTWHFYCVKQINGHVLYVILNRVPSI